MDARPLRRLAAKRSIPVLRSEDVDALVEKMQQMLASHRESFAEQVRLPDRAAEALPELPDLTGLAERNLRRYLEDEVIELEKTGDEDTIRPSEVRRELMMKALVGLKVPTLREVAERRGIASGGRGAALAERVAASYEWDEAEIAQLVLDHTQDPAETENGPATRIFVLRHAADFEDVRNRLAYAIGRYIRTGIAKWFVFQDYEASDESLQLEGSLRTYQALIDDAGDEAALRAQRAIMPSKLELHGDSRYLQVHGTKAVTGAKAMVSAFATATAQEVLEYVPGTEVNAQVVPGSLHPTTLFLLDVVTHRLRGDLFRRRNPVLARFRLAKGGATPVIDVDEEMQPKRRPQLSAVRFEGENLLDSPAACRLMSKDGRPLVDLTLRVQAIDSDTKATLASFPVRIAIETDNVLISTGLGTGDSQRVEEVHRAVVNAVQLQIQDGVDPTRAKTLNTVIRQQSASSEDEVEAKLLADDLEMI